MSSSKCSMLGGSLVAHEIGHGVYKFQHTFDYGVAEKSTDNLMDYNNGDFLAHYQWKVMQDSVMFVWGLLQDDEDGLLMDDIKIKAADFATNVVSKVGTSTNKMMENISMQIRDKVDEISQILEKIWKLYNNIMRSVL